MSEPTIGNRIGELCWYRTNVRAPWRSGILRAWSTDSQEQQDGVATYPVGVIEDDETRQCQSVYVGNINFSHEAPSQ